MPAGKNLLETASGDAPEVQTTITGREAALLAAVTLLGAALRYFRLGHKSVWLDESVSVVLAQISPANFFRWMAHPQQGNLYWLYNSLYYSLLHFWLKLGSNAFMLRLPSALAGAAAIPLIYLLGARFFSRRAGLIAALFLAVQPFHLAYSQEGRAYALTMLLAMLSFFVFVKAVEEDRSRWFVLFALVTVAMVYSHLYAALLLPAQALALFFIPEKEVPWKKVVVSFAAVLAAIFPVGLAALRETTSLQPWSNAMTLRDVFHAVQDASGTGIKFPIYLALMIAAAWGARRLSEKHLRFRAALLWGWLLVPVAAVSVGLHFKVLFFSRYLVMCVPAAMLLAAAGAARLRAQKWCVLLALCVAATSLPADVALYVKPKDDWRDAAAYVMERAKPQDALVFLPEYNQFPFEYYERRAHLPWLRVVKAATLAPAAGQRVWLILTPDVSGGANAQTAITWKQLSSRSAMLARQEFRAIHIYLFQAPAGAR